MEGRRLLEM